MIRRILLISAFMLFLPFAVHPSGAEGMPMEKFSYTADFEETDPVQFWVGSQDYTINFKGLTGEKCTSGKKCFKLDLTFGKDSYIYWRILMPRPVPEEGSLKFTGSVYLGEETTTGRVEIGPTSSYPPSTVSGTCPQMYSVKTKGAWLPMEGDMVDIAGSANIAKYDWGNPDMSNVCRYLDAMTIRLYGRKGDRVVIYLDDFKVNGEVPVSAEYGSEAAKRWQPVKDKTAKKIIEWESALDSGIKSINAIETKTEAAERFKRESLEKVPAIKALIANVKGSPVVLMDDAQKIADGIKYLDFAKHSLPMMVSLGNAKLAVTVIPPVSGIPVMPAGLYGTLGSKISVTAAQGEYEPASFVVHSMQGTKALTVKAGDLKQGNKTIPASNIDIKVVKCWYQAGTAWHDVGQDRTKRVLVPELMLNDDSLVKVDTEKKENYLKLSFPDGAKYAWISDPSEPSETVAKNKSVKDFPVKDSPVLLPVDIPADGNKQFWITIKVPENAAPGKYTGKIRLASADGDKAELTLNLNVLPFALPKPYYDSSIYYIGTLDPKDVGSISSELKNKTQLSAEFRNMVSHGVTKPIVYQGFDNKELLKEYLSLSKSAGIDNNPLYYLGFGAEGNISRVKEFLEFASGNGIKEVYFYGKDEARGQELIAQRQNWTNIRKLGGKIFVAGYPGENFSKMGDIQDLMICAFHPSKGEADKWHSAHHKVWNYANPQGGVENPEVNRRNFGLLLWQNNYDGAATFAYQYDFWRKDIWNDFDHDTYRKHNFTYPTVDGVIDTIAWEGYREGVDDIRYMTKLQQVIAAAEKSKDRKRMNTANQAKEYLKTIDASADNLDTVRSKMIDYILKLN